MGFPQHQYQQEPETDYYSTQSQRFTDPDVCIDRDELNFTDSYLEPYGADRGLDFDQGDYSCLFGKVAWEGPSAQQENSNNFEIKAEITPAGSSSAHYFSGNNSPIIKSQESFSVRGFEDLFSQESSIGQEQVEQSITVQNNIKMEESVSSSPTPTTSLPASSVRVKTKSTDMKGGASTRWKEEEDIILTGVVLDVYFRRHSLKPNKAERMEAKRKKLPVETLIWKKIHNTYETARSRHERLTQARNPPRTLRALQKRWKTTGQNKCVRVSATRSIPLSKYYDQLWDSKLNSHGLLTCSPEEFEAALAEKESEKATRSTNSGDEPQD